MRRRKEGVRLTIRPGPGQEPVAGPLRKDSRRSLRKSDPSAKLVLRKDHEGCFRNELARKDMELPELIERLWEGGGYGVSRDRRPFRFHAFVPDAIADWDRPLAGRAAEAIAQASAALSQFQAPGQRP